MTSFSFFNIDPVTLFLAEKFDLKKGSFTGIYFSKGNLYGLFYTSKQERVKLH